MKWLKYHIKAAVLSRRPEVYWGLRRLLIGLVEPEIALVRRLSRAGGTFLDVGASWGSYAHAASSLGLLVHAFEPQPRIAAVLRKGLAGVSVHEAAVSDVAGWTEIRVPRNDVGYATIEKANALVHTADLSRGIEVVRVPTVRLDDVKCGRVTLLKIDVEGHECAVLSGATALLDRDLPSLIVETEDRHNPGSRAAAIVLLEGRGYSTYAYVDARLQRPSDAHRNLIFIHDSVRPTLPDELFATE